MVSGSVNIGEIFWIARSSSTLNKKNIGSNSLVGLVAVVTKDVDDSIIVAGNLAIFIRKMGVLNILRLYLMLAIICIYRNTFIKIIRKDIIPFIAESIHIVERFK
jgi:serine acetyltransferase